MSSPGSRYSEAPSASGGSVAHALADPSDHHWFAEPTVPAGSRFTTAVVVAQLLFVIAQAGASAALGMAQNAGIYGGTLVAQSLPEGLLLVFVGPALLAVVAMAVDAFVLPGALVIIPIRTVR